MISFPRMRPRPPATNRTPPKSKTLSITSHPPPIATTSLSNHLKILTSSRIRTIRPPATHPQPTRLTPTQRGTRHLSITTLHPRTTLRRRVRRLLQRILCKPPRVSRTSRVSISHKRLIPRRRRRQVHLPSRFSKRRHSTAHSSPMTTSRQVPPTRHRRASAPPWCPTRPPTTTPTATTTARADPLQTPTVEAINSSSRRSLPSRCRRRPSSRRKSTASSP